MPNTPKPTIEDYQCIVDRAHKEIEGVRKVYIWLISCIGVLLIVFMACLALLSWSSVRDIADRIELQADLIKQRVDNRIDEQFDNKEIRLMVEEKARERIDAIADQLISKQIDQKITPLVDRVSATVSSSEDKLIQFEKKIDSIDHSASAKSEELSKTVLEAKTLLAEIQTQMAFTFKVLSAQADDRTAFAELETLAKTSNSPFKGNAEIAVRSIKENYASLEHSFMIYDINTNVNISAWSSEKLLHLTDILPSFYEAGILKSIWSDNNIPQHVKVSVFQDVLKGRGRSLTAADYARRRIRELSKIDRNAPFEFDIFIEWCETNKTPPMVAIPVPQQ